MKCFKNFSLHKRNLYALIGILSIALFGCDDIPDYVFVDNNLPSSSFTSNVDGLQASFTNNAAHATTYLWDFGDGETSSDVAPVHTYSKKGEYTVSLTATDNNGETDTFSDVVPVGLPYASFTWTALKTKATFTNTSANSSTYLWDFGDGQTSTEENPVHVYPDAGTYTVKLTASADGYDNSYSEDLTVQAKYQPIILSPSFEGSTSVYRVDWDWNGASGSGSPTPPDGTNACKLGTGDWVAQTFVVEANTDYTLRYWFVTKAGASIGAKITITDGVDSNISIVDTSTGPSASSDAYQEASIDFNSGNSTSITLSLIYGDSETRLDMFSIQ